jgi:phosphomannomutase
VAALDRIFKAYDIRGVVPDELDERVAAAVGRAFAELTGARRLVVGRDARPSGEALAAALSRGANDAGCDVVDVGLASTDLLYFASGSLDLPGVMLTASHNPPQYNGIKLCRAGAAPVGEETGLRDVRERVSALLAHEEAPVALRGSVERRDLLEAFAAHVRSFVDPGLLRPLSVVADTANGMGGLVAPVVFASLPFRLEVLFGELDGTFPNHPPDPIQPANLAVLCARVREIGADVGLAFDGDADRVFLVDDQGVPVPGSTTTAMVAARLLEKHPGATILYNVICSKSVPEVVAERGGRAIRTRVGHSFIKARMAETGALFGGEHSGHYYFAANWRADSGLIAAMVVLELLSVSDQPLSELRRPFERYFASGELNLEVADPAAVVECVAATAPERFGSVTLDRLDGVSVDGGAWWFNVRPSNTEPLVRLNVEAPDPESCTARTEEARALIEHCRDRTGSERS